MRLIPCKDLRVLSLLHKLNKVRLLSSEGNLEATRARSCGLCHQMTNGLLGNQIRTDLFQKLIFLFGDGRLMYSGFGSPGAK